ncbi:MAG: DUF2397 domain-containing protein [Propionibacteriaceae bacterium]|jgi:uncharacterized protein (TIGR02677 family)|nr:DUF2397 domain-containing protein [Propionibacteriaceae bacterium]
MQELTPWQLLPLPGAAPAASYLTGPLAKQYRLIVDILDDERTHSLTGIGHDELEALVWARLPADDARELLDDLDLDARMRQLVDWGTCESWQDRAESQQDFLRNRHRYQLTEAGAAFNTAARRIEADLGATSTAVLLAPATIVTRISATLAAVDSEATERASQEFAQVQTTLDAMGAAASEWQSRLAAALGGAPSEQKVSRLLETILAYVEAWGSGVDAWTAEITAALPRLREVPSSTWRAMALARLGADAPETLLEGAVVEMRAAVDTLAIWFAGERPQARRLRLQIRDAVAPVLRSHRTLLAVGGTVSRKADLLRLAAAIEQADGDDEAWRLWCAATGLYSARHVTWETPDVSGGPQTSTWEAPPAAISRRLRTQGARALSGRATRIADTSQARAEARREAARVQADWERAGAALAARSGTPFSSWQPLGATEAEILLDLVSAARNGRADDGTSTGWSADGRWRLVLTPRPGSAVLTTPDGRLVLPDADVEFGA